MSGHDTRDYPDDGYDDFLAAVEDGDPFYLECENGHGHLPPRRVCPDCGSTEFAQERLPAAGEVATYTVTHVSAPSFAEDTPYVTAVAEFGPLALTGQIRGVDETDLETGMTVGVGVEDTATTGEPLLVFRPR